MRAENVGRICWIQSKPHRLKAPIFPLNVPTKPSAANYTSYLPRSRQGANYAADQLHYLDQREKIHPKIH